MKKKKKAFPFYILHLCEQMRETPMAHGEVRVPLRSPPGLDSTVLGLIWAMTHVLVAL